MDQQIILSIMFKHKSLLQKYQWEDYDRKIDVGLSTIYQNNAYQDIAIQNTKSKPHPKYDHPGKKEEKLLQLDHRLNQSQKYLYTLQNKRVGRGKDDLMEQTFLNRKLKKKLKRKPNNKTTLENEQTVLHYSNQEKKPIKIGCYQFGEIDRKYQIRRAEKAKMNQFQSNHLKMSMKQRLKQFINTRRNQAENNINKQSGRYANPQKHQAQYYSLSSLERCSPIPPITNKVKHPRQEHKANYWDFTVVSLDNMASKRHLKSQINCKVNKLTKRQKLINKQSQQKRRECLYKSNLLKTYHRLSPMASSEKKERDFGDGSKLKQIIKKYFSSKDKYNSDEKLLMIHQITK